MRQIFLPYFFFAVFILLPSMAEAESSSVWQQEEGVSVRLLSASEAVGDGHINLGIDVRLEPGWKTYWRSPGAAGLPLTIDWSASTNLEKAELSWPAPERHETSGLVTYGYESHVILPLTVQVQDPAQPLVLSGKTDIMVCNEVCIPYTMPLALTLPAGPAEPSFMAGDIALWQSRVPPPTHNEMAIHSATLEDGLLTVAVNATPALTAPQLFIEAEGSPLFSTATYDQTEPNVLRAKLTGSMGTKALVTGTPLRLTLVDGTRMLDQTLPLQTSAAATPAVEIAPAGLLEMILIAFIGGIILNLMPCVLPILSLKLFTLMQHGAAPPRHVRLSFLASALGILTSFAVLAGVMIGMKLAGLQVGWGMQFQQPAFLIFIVVVLGLFAATLWDFIHIPLPRFLLDAVSDRLPRPGEGDHTLAGNFITGAFATLLATPCSAPFVGTAVGFALSGSVISIAIIFLAMGLGLASPYLLVAAFPRLARYLPRPGRWMGTLRALLGFALLGTALWLVSILQAEMGGNAVHVGGALLAALFILWLRHCIANPRMLPKGIVAIAIAIAAAFYLPPLLEGPAGEIRWQPFDEAAIPQLVSSGKIVLVDVTADWCLTCKVNERMVLNQPEVTALLNQPNVVAMRADFTSKDEKIFAYLRQFKRYGIPFNAIYGPGAAGLPLPELLSVSTLTEQLAKAEQQK